MAHQNKEVVLFINSMHAPTHSALRSYANKTGKHFKPVVIVDTCIKDSIHELNSQDHLDGNAEVISADFSSAASLRQALQPFEGQICAVTSQYENSIHELKKIVPYLPYLPVPTETSLDWATDKKLMREAFNAYDRSLSPQSIQVDDATKATVQKVEDTMNYPVIIKPSGLERSMLVAVAHNHQELLDTLDYTFKQLEKAHRQWLKRTRPTVLVEEFMEGDMYSIDTYIASDGTCRHASPIKVITGHKVGFEDFFTYLQLSPCGLSTEESAGAYEATARACKALGLRSITAHTELMNTPNGWKIIEVGPRIGGYRHELYGLSHDMNHIVNDIINRTGETPDVPNKPKRYAAIFKTYAQEEGRLKSIHGLAQVERLSSYVTMKHPYKKGDMLKFARNNGNAPIEITLCNDDQDQLRADIETIEKTVYVEVSPDNSVLMPVSSQHRATQSA